MNQVVGQEALERLCSECNMVHAFGEYPSGKEDVLGSVAGIGESVLAAPPTSGLSLDVAQSGAVDPSHGLEADVGGVEYLRELEGNAVDCQGSADVGGAERRGPGGVVQRTAGA